MSPSKKLSLLAVPFALAMLAAPSSAFAGSYVGLDLGVASILTEDDEPDADLGYGGGLRFGYSLPLPGLYIAPELGLTLTSFSFEGADDRLNIYGVRPGGRAGISIVPFVLRAGAYAHVGYTFIDAYNEEDIDGLDVEGGFAYDGGLFLDVTVLPLIDVGVHGGYSATSISTKTEIAGISAEDTDTGDWLEAGVHVQVSF